MSVTARTIGAITSEAATKLETSQVPSPRLEADILLAHVLNLERIELYKHPKQILSDAEATHYWELVEQRCQGVPTAYLRHKKEFFSMTFEVGSGVLIPRAETEMLVEEGLRVLRGNPQPRVLDLGTGSGAILIALLTQLPTARGVGVDLSMQALDYATKNAARHHVANRITFLHGDLFTPLESDSQFDLIVSNPPYISTNEISPDLRFEPREALDGGPDGLNYYRIILREAHPFMKSHASLLLEIGNVSESKIQNCLHEVDPIYTPPQFKHDLSDHLRILRLSPRLGTHPA